MSRARAPFVAMYQGLPDDDLDIVLEGFAQQRLLERLEVLRNRYTRDLAKIERDLEITRALIRGVDPITIAEQYPDDFKAKTRAVVVSVGSRFCGM